MGDQIMQAYEISAKCSICDIPLAGREQFVGHMIHGHDMALERAEVMWKSVLAAAAAAIDNPQHTLSRCTKNSP